MERGEGDVDAAVGVGDGGEDFGGIDGPEGGCGGYFEPRTSVGGEGKLVGQGVDDNCVVVLPVGGGLVDGYFALGVEVSHLGFEGDDAFFLAAGEGCGEKQCSCEQDAGE